jgi:hypothetical protein
VPLRELAGKRGAKFAEAKGAAEAEGQPLRGLAQVVLRQARKAKLEERQRKPELVILLDGPDQARLAS